MKQLSLRTLCGWAVRLFYALTAAGVLLLFCSFLPPMKARSTDVRIDPAPDLILGKMTEIAIGDDRLYAAYSAKCAVQVYTLDGAYLYTIYLPGWQQIQMYAAGDALWLQSHPTAPLAHFRGDAYLGRDDMPADAAPGGASLVHGGVRYEIRGADVIRTDASGAVRTLIDKPGWTALFHPQTAGTAALLMGFAGLALQSLAQKRKDKPRHPKQ